MQISSDSCKCQQNKRLFLRQGISAHFVQVWKCANGFLQDVEQAEAVDGRRAFPPGPTGKLARLFVRSRKPIFEMPSNFSDTFSFNSRQTRFVRVSIALPFRSTPSIEPSFVRSEHRSPTSSGQCVNIATISLQFRQLKPNKCPTILKFFYKILRPKSATGTLNRKAGRGRLVNEFTV